MRGGSERGKREGEARGGSERGKREGEVRVGSERGKREGEARGGSERGKRGGKRGAKREGDARGGGHMIYIRKQIPYKISHPQANNSSAMEKLMIEIPTPNSQTFTVSNWYLPPENSHYLQRTGVSLSEHQPDTKANEVICHMSTPMTPPGTGQLTPTQEASILETPPWMRTVHTWQTNKPEKELQPIK